MDEQLGVVPSGATGRHGVRAGSGRRSAGRVRVVVVVAVVVLLATACNDWLSYRGDAGRTGFAPKESVIGAGNVAGLTEVFSSVPVGESIEGSPVVDNDIVYVTSFRELLAFDARGVTNCAGSPVRCQPLWRASLAAPTAAAPTIAGGFVYTISSDYATSSTGKLQAFRAGTGAGCTADAGSVTRVCAPVWEADLRAHFASPTVVGGVLYTAGRLEEQSVLAAFDAAGAANCGGVPVSCAPLWTAASTSVTAPAVVAGIAYATEVSTGVVRAFDANGTNGCSGAPKVCAPLWSTTTDTTVWNSADGAIVSDGRLLRRRDTNLAVYDAAGVTNCTGTPKVCAPLWTARQGQTGPLIFDAVAYGNVYMVMDSQVGVYDLAGVNGCGGVPKTCAPLRWIRWAPLGLGNQFDQPTRGSSLTIANGLGFLGLGGYGNGRLIAFDATSTTGCVGTPLVCPILWSTSFTARLHTTPAVVDGRVFLATDDGVLHVFALPN